jgi:hypothetical protein
VPYNDAQVRLFQMVKHGKIRRKGVTKGKAASLLSEAGQSHNPGHPMKKHASASRALL